MGGMESYGKRGSDAEIFNQTKVSTSTISTECMHSATRELQFPSDKVL